MSWKDKIENSKFRIQTGDGKNYFPLLQLGSKEKEFNASTFDFINVENSYVSRKKPKSSKFDLVFYFQGDEHIEECNKFEESANDSRYWVVEHPYYGTIKGQPLSLKRNDNFLNITEVGVEFWESILNGKPRENESVKDVIEAQKESLDNSLSICYANKTNLKAIDQNRLTQFVNKINLSYDKLLDNVNYNEYQKTLSRTFSSIDKVLTGPSKLMKDVTKLINAPSEFVKSIKFRVRLMENLYNNMKRILKLKNKNEKAFFESFGGSLIASVCVAAFNPDLGDYITRKDVQEISSKINSLYQDYTSTMDEIQSPIESLVNSFVLDYDSQSKLSDIVNITLYNLFDVSFSAKQERLTEVEKDTNLIILTHKYIGLDVNDENIEKFRTINNISNRNVFGVKKGTIIKYFV